MGPYPRRPLILAAACAALALTAPVSAWGQGLFGDTVLIIGAFQEPIEETFGWIGDAAVGPDGGIFILDYQLPGISWFDSTGAFVAVMDREGSGPGEIKSPRAIAIGPDGHLYVLDPGNIRISEYDLSGGGFRFQGSVRHEATSYDLCTLDRGHVVAGLRDEALAHVLDSTGRPVRSFARLEVPGGMAGRQFAGLPAVSKGQINMSLLACDEASGTLVLVRRSMPLVEAFTTEGTSLWRTELEGLASPQWHVASQGLGAFGPDQQSLQEAAQVAVGDDRLVYVTYWESPREATRPEELEVGLQLRVLRLVGGEEMARESVGGRVFAVREGLAYLHDRTPFPRVVVVRLNTPVGR